MLESPQAVETENLVGRQREDPMHDFCWVEMVTDDRKAAQAFYGRLFGWEFEELTMQNGGTYAMFRPAAGGPGGGIMAKPQPLLPTVWMPYVQVADLEAAVARVDELGGEVQVGPTPIPGMGAFAVIEDPTGAVIGLWSKAA